jgi:hypothetical protein
MNVSRFQVLSSIFRVHWEEESWEDDLDIPCIPE